MSKVICIVGKICSGKSRYARELMREHPALLLSADELMTRLLPKYLGDEHDAYATKAQSYLFDLAVAAAHSGTDVVLDWGFWTHADRRAAREFFAAHGIETEWHCVSATDARWTENIRLRNEAVESGRSNDYYVDDGLLQKLESRFEEPAPEEIDLWITNK